MWLSRQCVSYHPSAGNKWAVVEIYTSIYVNNKMNADHAISSKHDKWVTYKKNPDVAFNLMNEMSGKMWKKWTETLHCINLAS